MSYMNCLYSLEINLLLVASFADISPYSLCCAFVWFMVSLAVQSFEVKVDPVC